MVTYDAPKPEYIIRYSCSLSHVHFMCHVCKCILVPLWMLTKLCTSNKPGGPCFLSPMDVLTDMLFLWLFTWSLLVSSWLPFECFETFFGFCLFVCPLLYKFGCWMTSCVWPLLCLFHSELVLNFASQPCSCLNHLTPSYSGNCNSYTGPKRKTFWFRNKFSQIFLND